MSDIKHIDPPAGGGRWVERWEAKSETRDTTYIVAMDQNGHFGCSCPAWKFQRTKMLAKNPDWICKHIRSVMIWRYGSDTKPSGFSTLGVQMHGVSDVGEGSIGQEVVIGGVSIRMIDLDDLD